MSDILREVDEAMRVERMNRLWQDHGKIILFIIGAIIFATGFDAAWTAYQSHQARTQTSALIEAIRSDDSMGQLDLLTQSLKGSGKGFAALDAAVLALDDKNYTQALSYYDQIISDKTIPQDLRDLAVVQKTSIQMDHDPDVSADDLLAALAPIASSDLSAWKVRAIFTSALIKAHKKNDYGAALEDVTLLSADPNVPSSLQPHIKAMMEVYSYHATQHTAQAAGE